MSALTAADYAKHEQLGIPAELLTRARVLRVTDAEARKDFGISGGGDQSGVAYPYWQPEYMMNGGPWRRWYARVRLDHPEGKRKYSCPYGDRRHFYFPPCPQCFADTDVPVVLVEAEKSSLALLAWCERTGRKLLPVAIGGCWSWRGKVGIKPTATGERVPDHDVLPDLNICRDGRATFVLLDANVAWNDDVARARSALVAQLRKQKADVCVLNLPAVEGANGPDDYVGTQGDEAMAAVFDNTDEGAEVLDATQTFIGRFVVISPAQSVAVALWVAHTYAFTAGLWTPYLSVTSAVKRSGKSRLLETVSFLVHCPWFTSSASAATLFRKIEQQRPTLLFDELDALFKGDKEMAEMVRSVLNSGAHYKGTVGRCIGQGTAITAKDFSTYCPKALAGIGHLPDTVADRSLPIRLERKLSNEKTERLRERTIGPQATELRNRLREWVQKQLPALKHAEPALPDELNDRQQDGAEILLAIADAAGGRWPDIGRAALTELYTGEDAADESVHVQLLTDIRTTFDVQVTDKIFSSDLASALAAIETSPWGEWRNGHPITKTQLARLLKGFRIFPGTVRIGDDTQKGYKRESFQAVWDRYLPPTPPFETSQPSHSSVYAGPDAFSNRHRKVVVTSRKSASSPVSMRFVTDVTDEKGGEP